MKAFQFSAIALATLTMAACGGGGGGDSDNGGSTTPPTTNPPVAGYYPTQAIPGNYADSRARAFDSLNSFRTACGFNALEQSPELDIAAQGHAEYVEANSSVVHTQVTGQPGFTGVTAVDRANAAGFQVLDYMEIVGAGITNSAATGSTGILTETTNHVDIETLIKRQLGSVYHHMGAFAEMRYAGIGYQQGANKGNLPAISYFDGFSVTLANNTTTEVIDTSSAKGVRTFPCEGITGVLPVFTPETPNPMPRSLPDQNSTPYGHPIYVSSDIGTNIQVTTFSIVANGTPVTATVLDEASDPNSRLASHQAYLVPDTELPPNVAVDVVIEGTVDGGNAFKKEFTFNTGTQL